MPGFWIFPEDKQNFRCLRAGIRWLLRTSLLISPKLEKVVILKVVSLMNIFGFFIVFSEVGEHCFLDMFVYFSYHRNVLLFQI